MCASMVDISIPRFAGGRYQIQFFPGAGSIPDSTRGTEGHPRTILRLPNRQGDQGYGPGDTA